MGHRLIPLLQIAKQILLWIQETSVGRQATGWLVPVVWMSLICAAVGQPPLSEPVRLPATATDSGVDPQPAQLPPEELAADPLADDIPVTDEPGAWWMNVPGSTVPLWTPPESWLTAEFWSGSVEFGLNGATGNSETLSLRSGAAAERKTERSELKSDLNYNKASADGTETTHSAIFNLRHELLWPESPWSVYSTHLAEYDEFRAFDLRYAVSVGLGYRFINTEFMKLVGRLGSGTSREIGGPNNRWSPEANFGLDYEHRLSERQKVSATIDYYPEWGEFADYRLNSSVNWEVLLSEASNMSLKLSATDRYDSTPEGRKANDLIYSVLLLWKF